MGQFEATCTTISPEEAQKMADELAREIKVKNDSHNRAMFSVIVAYSNRSRVTESNRNSVIGVPFGI